MQVEQSKKFKKDIKILQKQKFNIDLVKSVINQLVKNQILDRKYCDHKLVGNWYGHRECHIKPDVILIYEKTSSKLKLARISSHSELFN